MLSQSTYHFNSIMLSKIILKISWRFIAHLSHEYSEIEKPLPIFKIISPDYNKSAAEHFSSKPQKNPYIMGVL